MKNLIYFLIGFSLAFFSGLALAVVPPASLAYTSVSSGALVPWSMDLTGSGDHYYKPPRADAWERVTADNSYNKSLPYNLRSASGGNVKALVPVKIPVDIPKIGKAVSKFAQRVGPLSMGFAMADLICEASDICKDSEDKFVVSGSDFPSGQHYYEVCPYDAAYKCVDMGAYNGGQAAQCATYNSAPYSYGVTGDGSGGFLGFCRLSPSYTPSSHEATSDDWAAAEAALSSAPFIAYLDAAREPIPTSLPELTPTSIDGPSSDVVNRDAAGVPTGSTRTQTKYDLTPAPTSSDPFRVQIQETTTITNFDIAGDVITTVVSTTNPDPVDEDSTVKFDEITKIDVPNAEMPNEFEPQDWGSSADCPANPVINIYGGHSLTIPVNVVCDAMGFLKPVVLLISTLAAGLIIMGAVKT